MVWRLRSDTDLTLTFQSIVSFCFMINILKSIWNYQYELSSTYISVFVFNIHEDKHQNLKPENGIRCWMPNYVKIWPSVHLRVTNRQARKFQLFRDCFSNLLGNWNGQTKSSQNIVWGNQMRRQTLFFSVRPWKTTWYYSICSRKEHSPPWDASRRTSLRLGPGSRSCTRSNKHLAPTQQFAGKLRTVQ